MHAHLRSSNCSSSSRSSASSSRSDYPPCKPPAQPLRRTQCLSNLKQLGVAAQNYHSTYRSFPVGMLMQPGLVYTESTFFIRLLPFLEEQALYDTWNFKTPASNVSTNVSQSRAATKINSLLCPSDLFESNPYSLPGPVSPSPSTELARRSPRLVRRNQLRGQLRRRLLLRPLLAVRDPPQRHAVPYRRRPATEKGVLHTLVENHYDLSPAGDKNITDGTSKTLLMGEKYHFDDFFDTWTSSNSGLKMYQVSAWAWAGGPKGAAHLFCSSAVQMNFGARAYSSTPNNTKLKTDTLQRLGQRSPRHRLLRLRRRLDPRHRRLDQSQRADRPLHCHRQRNRRQLRRGITPLRIAHAQLPCSSKISLVAASPLVPAQSRRLPNTRTMKSPSRRHADHQRPTRPQSPHRVRSRPTAPSGPSPSAETRRRRQIHAPPTDQKTALLSKASRRQTQSRPLRPPTLRIRHRPRHPHPLRPGTRRQSTPITQEIKPEAQSIHIELPLAQLPFDIAG